MTIHAPHHHHDAVAARLKRAEGHLRSILQMMEEQRPCLDLAQQLHAVEKAISQAKKVLIQDHIDHCLEDAVGELDEERRRTIDEFKEITKYL
ncbi:MULTISPECIES: metal-sensing transcriptional repressor [Achromobacter]|uniref:metal-sensing transcriptional repressor n=1 Tax=Achromobacter TaxID=222 RepID=UPI002FE2EDCF